MLLYSTDPCGLQDSRRAQCGFSLVELMIVVALLGIAMAIAAPSFSDMISRQRVRNVADDLYTTLMFARSTAITRLEEVSVSAVKSKADESETYLIVCLGDCPDSPAEKSDILEQQRILKVPEQFKGVFDPADFDSIVFRTNGRPKATPPTIELSYGSTKRCVSLNASGSPSNGECE